MLRIDIMQADMRLPIDE